MMIEQPLSYDDFFDHARLQERISTPVCLDESIKCEGDLALALELGSCQIVNVKPGRVGGLGVSRRLHDTMRARGMAVWCGGMLESGVGRAHNVALASLPGFTLPGDISASRRYWERDIVTPEFEVEHGVMRGTDRCGSGCRARCRPHSRTHRAGGVVRLGRCVTTNGHGAVEAEAKASLAVGLARPTSHVWTRKLSPPKPPLNAQPPGRP